MAMKLLKGSRQSWWHRVGMALVLIGGAVMAWAIFQLEVLDDASFAFWILSGTLLGLIGFLSLSLMVRCPQCGTRLFWYAVSQVPGAGGVAWYNGLEECPKCAYRGVAGSAGGGERRPWAT